MPGTGDNPHTRWRRIRGDRPATLEAVLRALFPGPAPGSPRAVVLLLHGGAERGDRPVDERSASLRRMRWLHRGIGPPLAAAGCASALLRFSVRGWNADAPDGPSPITDARWAIAALRTQYGGLPVVLLGHSMGARTGLHVAGDPAVVGLVGLAPWFPPDDPVAGLAGVHVTAAHGSRDRITSARATRRLLARSEPVAASTRFVGMGPLGHYMLTHVRRWNRVAVRESLAIVERSGLPDGRSV